jgi:hypothetical protein
MLLIARCENITVTLYFADLRWLRAATTAPRSYGKISPGVFEVAAAKRVWMSGQLTTFQNAFT